jgi:hypothetical protein
MPKQIFCKIEMIKRCWHVKIILLYKTWIGSKNPLWKTSKRVLIDDQLIRYQADPLDDWHTFQVVLVFLSISGNHDISSITLE